VVIPRCGRPRPPLLLDLSLLRRPFADCRWNFAVSAQCRWRAGWRNGSDRSDRKLINDASLLCAALRIEDRLLSVPVFL